MEKGGETFPVPHAENGGSYLWPLYFLSWAYTP
jgi:hypothetical protein